MPSTTIVLVPGFWLGPRPYDLLTNELKKQAPSPGFDVVFGPLLSTGTRSPNAPTMADDAAHIRSILVSLVGAGRRVVIVAHSAGAFLSAMATEGLEVGVWEGGEGGVERFVFVAGGVLPKGGWHPPTNWEAENGAIWLQDVDEKLLHDVPPAIAQQHCIPHIKSQPTLDEWSKECTYTGWDKVPSSYIICEKDRVIDPEVQGMCAGLAGSEVVRIPTGHMPMLTCPGVLAEKVMGCMKLGQ